jgi:hypothetical protein
MWSIMGMQRFSHLLWANLTSCHFFLFLNFTPLYIFLIYGVFFNKTLHDSQILHLAWLYIKLWCMVFHILQKKWFTMSLTCPFATCMVLYQIVLHNYSCFAKQTWFIMSYYTKPSLNLKPLAWRRKCTNQ